MRAAITLALAIALLAGSLGCPDTTLRAEDFDDSCAEKANCVPVFLGDLCSGCTCPNAAISAIENTRYLRERDAIDCGPFATPTSCSCEAAFADCVEERCVFEEGHYVPPPDAGPDAG
jgi:hypothetical protein